MILMTYWRLILSSYNIQDQGSTEQSSSQTKLLRNFSPMTIMLSGTEALTITEPS